MLFGIFVVVAAAVAAANGRDGVCPGDEFGDDRYVRIFPIHCLRGLRLRYTLLLILLLAFSEANSTFFCAPAGVLCKGAGNGAAGYISLPNCL